MIKPHWKFSRFLDTHFLAVEGSHFGSGSRILFHRRQCTGSQPGQNGEDFEFAHSIRTAFVIAAEFNM